MKAEHCRNSSQSVELKLTSHPANLAQVRRRLESFAADCGFDQTACGEIGLCVNEAIANVIRHAYHGLTDRPIVIGADWCDDVLHITIRDWGSGVKPRIASGQRRNPLRPGGLGILCMRQLMHDVVFTVQSDGMLLSMTRKLCGERRRRVG